MDETTAKARRQIGSGRAILLVGVTAVVTAALSVPLTAYAVSSRFSDVPPTHPFSDEISWMEDTKISEGYPDGTYRPGDPMTRQAMSAFMQRLYDVKDDFAWQTGSSIAQTSSETWVDISGLVASVDVPDGVYATIDARFTAESQCLGGAGTWCSVRLVVSEDGGPFTEMRPIVGGDYGFDSGEGGDKWESHAIERLEFGDPGTQYRVKAQYQVSGPGIIFHIDDWALVAESHLQPSDYLPL